MEPSDHKLTLTGRQKLSLSGVTEVVSFDEGAVVLHTELGTLTVQGRDLHLRTLAPEGGRVEVDGEVCALIYEEPGAPGGWLGRLFR